MIIINHNRKHWKVLAEEFKNLAKTYNDNVKDGNSINGFQYNFGDKVLTYTICKTRVVDSVYGEGNKILFIPNINVHNNSTRIYVQFFDDYILLNGHTIFYDIYLNFPKTFTVLYKNDKLVSSETKFYIGKYALCDYESWFNSRGVSMDNLTEEDLNIFIFENNLNLNFKGLT